MLRQAALLTLDLTIAGLNERMIAKPGRPAAAPPAGATPPAGRAPSSAHRDALLRLPAVPDPSDAPVPSQHRVPSLAPRQPRGRGGGAGGPHLHQARCASCRCIQTCVPTRETATVVRRLRSQGGHSTGLDAGRLQRVFDQSESHRVAAPVHKLEWNPTNSTWSNYRTDNSYSVADTATKSRFDRLRLRRVEAGAGLGSRRQRRPLLCHRRPAPAVIASSGPLRGWGGTAGRGRPRPPTARAASPRREPQPGNGPGFHCRALGTTCSLATSVGRSSMTANPINSHEPPTTSGARRDRLHGSPRALGSRGCPEGSARIYRRRAERWRVASSRWPITPAEMRTPAPVPGPNCTGASSRNREDDDAHGPGVVSGASIAGFSSRSRCSSSCRLGFG